MIKRMKLSSLRLSENATQHKMKIWKFRFLEAIRTPLLGGERLERGLQGKLSLLTVNESEFEVRKHLTLGRWKLDSSNSLWFPHFCCRPPPLPAPHRPLHVLLGGMLLFIIPLPVAQAALK